MPLINQCLLVVSPEHHDTLKKAGMDSKHKLSAALWREAGYHMLGYFPSTLVLLARMKKLRVPSFVLYLLGMAGASIGYLARLLRLKLTLLPKFNKPESIKIVVAGAAAGKFSSYMPGFGVGKPGMSTADMSKPVTMAIEPRPVALDCPLASITGAGDILNPTSEIAGTLLNLARRPGIIQGPVALMDISKARGSELLDAMEAKLKAEGIDTRRYMKPTFSRPCPSALMHSMISECKSAILGLAD
eukprot:gnl/MRDRNA2_/MRDRNA2_208364_c0_seq1.p1 gnl/MRDRNA2_/MRDRNA2_208364_c0~~gnl/MRDRNA2_/MRDRNA2_208364_c0_seq1.p1  ORF type:complete len:245 (+),score=42.88 gnl/MRDRNA2_/MRDRNA2_208364_c0_seq1:3-737(+)